MQYVEVPQHGRFEFDVDVYEKVWTEHQDKSETWLRAVIAEMAYDSVRDVNQMLSRFELIAMLAEFETNRINEQINGE